MPTYVNDQVSVAGYFSTADGTPADPTTVVLSTLAPDGTLDSSTSLTHSATGTYTGSVVLNQAGTWSLEMKGTGAIVARFILRVTVVQGIT